MTTNSKDNKRISHLRKIKYSKREKIMSEEKLFQVSILNGISHIIIQVEEKCQKGVVNGDIVS